MPINPDAVGEVGEEREVSWTATDSLLYALGVGAGADDPVGPELAYTTENSKGVEQRVLPTQVVVLGGGRGPDFGDYDLVNLLHGGQSIELFGPLPAEGRALSQTRVAGIYDKGKAAVVELETAARAEGGTPMWTATAILFIWGEGGWGGDRGPSDRWTLPEREADHVIGYDTRPDQALLYRLSGDRNPLHSDPTFAAAAGYDVPILHGLCTFGFAGRALLHTLCEGDPGRFQSMGGRFKSPVLPGERLDTHVWFDDGQASFQIRVEDRVVFDAGTCRYD